MNSLQSSVRMVRRLRRGFSLMEVLIVTTLLSVLMLMVLRFQTDMVTSMFTSDEKGRIDTDIRNLTQQMSDLARDASFFVLYSNYTVAARSNPNQELAQGNPGDFMVLVFYNGTLNTGPNFNVRPVDRIVGYYRAPYQSGQSADFATNQTVDASYLPVRKFDISVAGGGIPANTYLTGTGMPSGGTTATLESLLPNDSSATITSHAVVVQLTQGLADGCLFFNFWGKSIMVNGKIVHGNDAKRVTDTYNFTISPRG